MKLALPWSRSREPDPELQQVQQEAQELRAELAQSVVRFGQSRSRVASVADDAMALMNGEPR